MRALLIALSVMFALVFAACIWASAYTWAHLSNNAASLTLALASLLPLWACLSTADYARTR